MELRGNQVHLGLDAPPEVKIFREEIYRAIVEEREEMSQEDADRLSASRPSVH